MSTGLRGVSRHALIYGLGTLATKAVGFLMLPVYTRFLTPADYGAMELIGMTLDVIAIVAGAQIAMGIFRYHHKTDDAEEKRRVVSTAFLALTISYLVLGLATFAAAGLLAQLVFRSREHTTLIQLAGLTLCSNGMFIVGLNYARLKERSGVFVAANLTRLVLQLSLNIVLIVVMKVGVVGIFISNLSASTIVSLAIGLWVVRESGLRPSRSATKDLTRFGAPLVLTNLATFFVAFGDRYFLEAFQGTADVGRYALAYQFGFLLSAIGYAPFTSAWDTRRFALAAAPNRDALYSRAFLYMNYLLLTLAVGMALFAPEVLRVMATADFRMPAVVIVCILVAYVLQGWSHMHEIGILLAEQTKRVAIANWLAAAAAAIGYATLIPTLGMIGAGIATVAAFVTRWTVTYCLAQRATRIAWAWGPVLRLTAVAVAAMTVAAVLPDLPLATSLAVRSGVFAAYAVLVWFSGAIGDVERDFIARALRSPGSALAALRG